MQLILLKGREHPIVPQIPIVLLHRSSTQPLHFDATQPTFIIPLRHEPNPPNTGTPNALQDLSTDYETPLSAEQHSPPTDETTTSPLSYEPYGQPPPR